MIISRINGGLGNQMFQYATGRAIALRNKTILKVDPENCDKDTARAYELDYFATQTSIATPEEVARLNPKRTDLLTRIKRRVPFLPQTHIVEKHFHFDPSILQLGDNCYLQGFWQTEKYFLDVADTIRQELTLTTPLDAENKKAIKLITDTTSVGLHIRRGDYVTHAEASKHHGTCSLAYYQEAITHLATTIPDFEIFIFSDDPQWAKDNLKLAHPTHLMTHNGPNRGYEDMRLLSNCKHFIIANSTFSWWGAWLSTHPHKQIVAPKKWFAGSTSDTSDLIPASWTRL